VKNRFRYLQELANLTMSRYNSYSKYRHLKVLIFCFTPNHNTFFKYTCFGYSHFTPIEMGRDKLENII
jgi:hypothetical protein